MEAIIWGACLRIAQATLQAAPFIFTGLCVMGLLHRLLGQAHTRWLFGSNSIVSLFQSWLIGMLLPGCSLGTIPIVKQMRRSGIAVGTIFAFALSSPLFDPLSLLYGLTLSKPFTIVAFAFFSLVVVTVSGTLFDWLFPSTGIVPTPEPLATPYGIKRLLATLVVMARESVSSSAILIGIGLLGTGLLSTVLPAGSLQRTMSHENPYSPLLMTSIAIPAYATPMNAMGQLGSMFQHGNSVGAAFILLVFGAGMNLGLLAWMWFNYGWKQTVVWIGLMLLIVVGISYGIERPFYPKDVEAADHTHAFDRYCQPFEAGSRPVDGYMAEIYNRIQLETLLHEWVGAGLLVGLAVFGIFLRWLDRRWVIEAWLTRAPIATSRKSWDIVLPGPVLGSVGLLAIIGTSIVGCFAYYPEPRETLEELNLARVEAFSAAVSGKHELALHWIGVCDSWNRRLQVGALMRHWQLSNYHRVKSQIFEDHLDILEHTIENGDPQEKIQSCVAVTSAAFRRLSYAYREEMRQ